MDNNFDSLLDLPLREILKLAAEGKEAKDTLAEIRATLGFQVERPAPAQPRASTNTAPPVVLKRTKAKTKQFPCKDCGKVDDTIKYNRCSSCRKRHQKNGSAQEVPIDKNAPITQAWIIEFKARVSADPKFAAQPGVVETLRQVNAGVKPLFKHLPTVVQEIRPSAILASTERK